MQKSIICNSGAWTCTPVNRDIQWAIGYSQNSHHSLLVLDTQILLLVLQVTPPPCITILHIPTARITTMTSRSAAINTIWIFVVIRPVWIIIWRATVFCLEWRLCTTDMESFSGNRHPRLKKPANHLDWIYIWTPYLQILNMELNVFWGTDLTIPMMLHTVLRIRKGCYCNMSRCNSGLVRGDEVHIRISHSWIHRKVEMIFRLLMDCRNEHEFQQYW